MRVQFTSRLALRLAIKLTFHYNHWSATCWKLAGDLSFSISIATVCCRQVSHLSATSCEQSASLLPTSLKLKTNW